jgi:hypothetical protein
MLVQKTKEPPFINIPIFNHDLQTDTNTLQLSEPNETQPKPVQSGLHS